MNKRQKKKLVSKRGIRKWNNIKSLRKIAKNISSISSKQTYSFNDSIPTLKIINTEIIDVYIISTDKN